MLVTELAAVLQAIAPLEHAASWDNVGLLIGDPKAPVARVRLAIDYTPAVADECERVPHTFVVAYHPPWFAPVRRLTAEHPMFQAILRGMAIYSPHTALDVAPGGTNDVLSEVLGLEEVRPLRAEGGKIGELAPIERSDLIAKIKRALGVEHLLVAGPTAGIITRAAACAGSCGDLFEEAIAQRSELYLTGEMKHHDALRAARAGMTVVCALHSNSERIALGPLARAIARCAPGLDVAVCASDADPFTIR